MRKFLVVLMLSMAVFAEAAASEYNKIPVAWKWVSGTEVAFTYDYSFKDANGFVYNVKKSKQKKGVNYPLRFSKFPVTPVDAVNMTFSPDSSKIAFTRANNLWVVDIASGKETQLTFDGTDLILNGYASWVYYEEIFGRPSKYRAFWWSPDSRKIGFYRFDNTQVPLFPIYSPVGQDGILNNTRYPKAGEKNPEVRIGMVHLDAVEGGKNPVDATVWADFNPSEDQYFGTPFWGKDSKGFFVSREPRTQNTLDLYRVDAADGSKTAIYHEEYPTWLDWMDGVLFTDEGLYMARAFETGWQQIYFLSYDGKTLKRLTDGPNWNITLVAVDEKKSEVYFTAKRESTTRLGFYKVSKDGSIVSLTDMNYSVSLVALSPDFKYFVAQYNNARTPTKVAVFTTDRPVMKKGLSPKAMSKALEKQASLKLGTVVADMAGADFDASKYSLPQEVFITTPDGFQLPGLITYPMNFDENAVARYPVHFEVYGGPDTPYVRDTWRSPSDVNQWFARNGIIHMVVDPRSAGHNGRAGEDMAYKRLTVYEIKDYVAWAKWISSFPYVNTEKIGVEGFSFGGTTTVMLLCQANRYFRYGIAGGGVYDWRLYDTHYTERFMDTPQNNPEGYEVACALNWVKNYPVSLNAEGIQGTQFRLKLTHGTGDDNVHFQNTLQLVDAMQKAQKDFDLMIYPDGMHGYRGAQGAHSLIQDREFWNKYLLDR